MSWNDDTTKMAMILAFLNDSHMEIMMELIEGYAGAWCRHERCCSWTWFLFEYHESWSCYVGRASLSLIPLSDSYTSGKRPAKPDWNKCSDWHILRDLSNTSIRQLESNKSVNCDEPSRVDFYWLRYMSLKAHEMAGLGLQSHNDFYHADSNYEGEADGQKWQQGSSGNQTLLGKMYYSKD